MRSWIPTHDSIQLRHGWGTQISGDVEDQLAEVGGGFHFAEGSSGFFPVAGLEDGAETG